MSMRIASPLRSPCEVVRQLNDLFQGDDPREVRIRKLLAEVERKTKRISIRLAEHEPDYYLGWWKENETFETDNKTRSNPGYKVG